MGSTGTERGGFGDLIRQRTQQVSQPVIPQSVVQPGLSQPTGQEAPQDPLVRRYWLYAELYKIGGVKDKEYVKSAVKIEELAQVVRAVLPNSPRAIALEYVAKYKGDVTGLLKELLEHEQIPDWLRKLVNIALGGEDASE